MGSRKKLVLASLVSLMVALAFLVGLMPSESTLGANAASGSSGQAALWDKMLNALRQGDPPVAINVTAPADATLVKVPADSVAAYLSLRAAAQGGDAAPVRYGVDGEVVEGVGWTGSVYSAIDSLGAPRYASYLNLAPLLTGLAGTQSTHWLYAFANAQVTENLGGAEIQYSVRSFSGEDEANEARVIIEEIDPNIDADDNGFPDDLFGELLGNDVWLAAYEVPTYDADGNQSGTTIRYVAAGNLSGAAAKQQFALGVTVTPTPNVAVTAPALADLQDAGAIGAGESGILLVSVVSDLSALLDRVDGSTAPAALGQWAAATDEYAPPGGLLPGTDPLDTGSYVEISIVATTPDGEGFEEVETLPEDLPVTLELSNLQIPADHDVALWAIPTDVINIGSLAAPQYVLANTPGLAGKQWGFRALRNPEIIGQDADGFVADLTELSVFGAFESILSIESIYPSAGPANATTPVRIDGDFDLGTNLTLAQANAAFGVYFGGVRAAFDSSQSFPVVANAKAANSMYVIAPAQAAGIVDVVVEDATNPANIAVAPDGYAYVGPRELIVSTSGTGGGTTTPSGNNMYAYNTLVTVTATPDANSEFFAWVGDIDGATSTSPTIQVRMDQDRALTAVFVLKTFTLTRNVLPDATYGSVSADPAGPMYTIGTTVSLLATANAGYVFERWEGDLSGPINPQDITMDANKSVTAVFSVQTVTFGLTVLPSDGGSVVPDPTGTYPLGTVVPLTAVADSGYTFLRWEGPVDLGASVNPNTVTMNANKTIRPVFIANSPTIGSIATSDVPGARAEAWLFGGVVARLTGQGFKNSATVMFGDQQADIVQINSPTDIYVVVPPLADDSPADKQYFYVSVTLTNAPGGPSDTFTFPGDEAADVGFRYKRYGTDVDGATATAFQITGAKTLIDVALDSTLGAARLDVPAIGGQTPYGLIRATKNPADVYSNLIDSGAGSAVIGNIWDFAVHLYDNTYPLTALVNTQPLGAALYPEINDWVYPRAEGATTASIEFPVNDTTPSLMAANVQAGLSLWSLETDYDYGTGDTTPTLGSTAYQSTLLSGEAVDAASQPIGSATAGATVVDTVAARIYDFSAFSLRARGLDLPASLKQGVQLDTDDGTASGATSGGLPLSILAPNGGFGWVTVAFGDIAAGKAASDYPNATVVNPGLSEFQIDIQSPAWTTQNLNKDKVVDIAIYLNSNLNTPVVVLEDVFTYKANVTPVPPIGLFLVLLGLGAALIGLAAGGSSGGGGGGPCFIATAAYGTPMADQIDTLRVVRDTYLLDNAVGTALVDTYYRVSPAIADVVAQSPVLAAAVRFTLVPVLFMAKLALAMPHLTAMLIGVLTLSIILRRKRSTKA